MTTNATVTGEPVTPTVPEAGMGAGGTAPAGVGATGTGDAGSGDPIEARIAAERAKMEADLRKLQSTLDRNLAEERRQAAERERLLKEELERVQTANMDEKERAVYEANKWKREYEALLNQQQQIVAQTQAQREMQEYAQELHTRMGIDPGELDFTNQETLATSAFNAIERRLKGTPAPTSTTPAQPVQPVNNRILTTGPGTPPKTRVTHADLKGGYEKRVGRTVTDEEYWRAAERGDIDMSQLSIE